MKRIHYALSCACLLALAPAVATAQTDAGKVAAARQIGFDGIKDYQAGDYTAASDKLERAYALVQAPTIGLWSARALSKIGRLVLASERYLETTRLAVPETNRENHVQAQADAAKEREALLPRIPSLRVDVEGVPVSELVLSMDGVAINSALIGVARPVDPGKRRVVAKHGEQEQSKEIELAEGAKETVSFTFAPAQAPVVAPAPTNPEPAAVAPPPAERDRTEQSGTNTLAYVALAAGGAGLVVGGITGVMALGKKSDLDDSPYCSDDSCGPEVHDDVDSLNTLRTVSTIGFVVGAVGVGVGVTLLLTGGGSERAPAARTELRIGPGAVGLRGTF
jgi:hypothetical protein